MEQLRFRRGVISWEEAFATLGDSSSAVCPAGDSHPAEHWILAFSILLNALCAAIIFRVPMLRGVVRHVLTTTGRNVISFVMRERVATNIEMSVQVRPGNDGVMSVDSNEPPSYPVAITEDTTFPCDMPLAGEVGVAHQQLDYEISSSSVARTNTDHCTIDIPY